jgi:hypothetical protein
MRHLLALIALATPVWAGGLNTTFLVPAYVTCVGPDICSGTPARESSFTFESATLRTPRSPFADPKKPSLIVELKGVKDAGGRLVTANGFSLQISSGQVNLFEPAPGFSLPAGHPLSVISPVSFDVTNGHAKLAYKPGTTPPAGTVAEGGAVTIYDNAGKRLAVIGTRYR